MAISKSTMEEEYRSKHGRKTHNKIYRKYRQRLIDMWSHSGIDYQEWFELSFANDHFYNKHYPQRGVR